MTRASGSRVVASDLPEAGKAGEGDTVYIASNEQRIRFGNLNGQPRRAGLRALLVGSPRVVGLARRDKPVAPSV